jgi:endonuclease/exonuclease/phosphatase family metal-dependent hydrolase
LSKTLLRVATLFTLVWIVAVPARANTLMWIDAPVQGAQVAREFFVGGWAIDTAARADAGISVIHVWAYPADGRAPIFLGETGHGARPDVAQAFGGPQFHDSGFGVIVRGLRPGAYMIAFFPFNTAMGGFDFGRAVGVNVTVVGTAPVPAPPPAPAPVSEPEPAGAAQLKVLHWNIHHGVGTDGDYNIDRLASWMARFDPDVISINEAEKNTYWGREDQPARFAQLLTRKTGRTWYAHFAQEFGGGDANGKGNLVLSRFPFTSTGRDLLSWDRTMSTVSVVVNGRTITFTSTHLDPDSRSRRLTQAQQILSLANQYAEARIICGDFNAWPDQSSVATMTTRYRDAWAEAAAAGRARSFAGNNGETRKGRIDYVYYSKGASVLSLRKVEVPDTRDAAGRMPSDHRPVLATFDVK